MNFSVYSDSGLEIHGYLVPDGYSKRPTVAVYLGGERPTIIECDRFVEGAKNQGLHDTGLVGFVLTDENVPGLSVTNSVELADVETGFVFYRRAVEGQYLPHKVFRLETRYAPHIELDNSLKPYFQFFAHSVERYGAETIRQMLEVIHQPSVYVSGRIMVKNFRVYLDYNTDMMFVSLRDPFYELAVRIFTFSLYSKHKFRYVPERDLLLFKPVLDHFDQLNVLDEGALRRAIRAAPKDAIKLLASPFTHQLVATSPGELAPLDSVSIALDTLSQFTLFDTGDDQASFPGMIAERLGVPRERVRMNQKVEAIQSVASILRELDTVHHLLETDLILHHFVRQAEKRAAATG